MANRTAEMDRQRSQVAGRPELYDGVESTASIAKHPIHPMIVPFPIAFLVGALLADIAYWWTDNTFWSEAALWLVGAGVVTGLFAGLFGLMDFLTIKRVRDHTAAWVHGLGNMAALAVAGLNWWWRVGNPTDAVLPWGIVMSGVIAMMLLVTGWYGGELSYRHRIGMVNDYATHER